MVHRYYAKIRLPPIPSRRCFSGGFALELAGNSSSIWRVCRVGSQKSCRWVCRGYRQSERFSVTETNYPALNTELNPDKSFAELGVSPEICRALEQDSITHPFLIQALTLPVALMRRDIIGQAKTGTGKTLGFGLPLLMHVVQPDSPEYADRVAHLGAPQALVVLPTRELCKQVTRDLQAASRYLRTRITCIYGGVAIQPQIAELRAGTDVVVGTPGRLLDLENRGVLRLDGVTTLVLDEADEMFDLGFQADVESLLRKVNPDRHSMLFSATMPGPVIALARQFMNQPTHIHAQDPADEQATVSTVKQFFYRCHPLNKLEVLTRILQAENRGKAIVFVKTKRSAAQLNQELRTRGFAVGALHGDLAQGAREQALRALANGKVDVLVATDVAARGIDVEGVTHVVNYQCPEDDKVYLHRIGRTARAGATGTAITFIDWEEVPRWKVIDRTLDLGHPEPVETYHTSDHLYTDLGIPRDVADRLPRSQRRLPGLQAEKLEDLGEPGRRHQRQGNRENRGNRRRTNRSRRAAGTSRTAGADNTGSTGGAGAAKAVGTSGAFRGEHGRGSSSQTSSNVGGGHRRVRRRSQQHSPNGTGARAGSPARSGWSGSSPATGNSAAAARGQRAKRADSQPGQRYAAAEQPRQRQRRRIHKTRRES